MSETTNQAPAEWLSGGETGRDAAALRAVLITERDNAIADVLRNIAAAESMEELSDDIRSGLVHALKRKRDELKGLDLTVMTDIGSMKKVRRQIREILS